MLGRDGGGAAPEAGSGVLIELAGVGIGYRHRLMRPISMTVHRGDFWGIVGPNGAGKTTLVRTVAGLLAPVSGAVRFPSGRPRFGYVPQRHVLDADYPLTVFDVVAMGRAGLVRPGRRLGPVDRSRTLQELERVGLATLADRPFASLSGGQQQRALLARALASDPGVLILDEPTSGMDLPRQTDFLAFVKRLHLEHGMTLLMIDHHIDQVVTVADHLCLMNRDTDLFEAGAMDQVLEPGRLSAAYGRPVQVDRRTGTVLVQPREVPHD